MRHQWLADCGSAMVPQYQKCLQLHVHCRLQLSKDKHKWLQMLADAHLHGDPENILVLQGRLVGLLSL